MPQKRSQLKMKVLKQKREEIICASRLAEGMCKARPNLFRGDAEGMRII